MSLVFSFIRYIYTMWFIKEQEQVWVVWHNEPRMAGREREGGGIVIFQSTIVYSFDNNLESELPYFQT